MSSEEMERVIAQQVANAIEAIAIYESKIRMAHDSMNQVVREEAMVGKNVSNERKWGSDHGNKKAYAGNLPYCNKCKWHHIGPCIVKYDNFMSVSPFSTIVPSDSDINDAIPPPQVIIALPAVYHHLSIYHISNLSDKIYQDLEKIYWLSSRGVVLEVSRRVKGGINTTEIKSSKALPKLKMSSEFSLS
ncbi:hypothetical protein Tco_0438330 [Tanacetum coccineum]